MSLYKRYKKKVDKPIIEKLFGEPTSKELTVNENGTVDICFRWEEFITEDAEFEIIQPKELPNAPNLLRE